MAHQSSMVVMLDLAPIPIDLRCDVDSPLSMSDCESLESICDYEEIYQHRANVEEVNIATAEKERVPKLSKQVSKNRTITKIFKDKSFSPSLEDIKEVDDKKKENGSVETPYLLSLSHVHYDRAFNHGFLEQDSGRSFRSHYWKSVQQQQRMKKSSRRRTISV